VRTLLRLARLFMILGLTVAILTAATVIVMPHVADLGGAHVSEPQQVNLDPLFERSYVYDRYGNRIHTFAAEENRVLVALAEVPETVVQPILAVEDDQFYEHNGVNLRAVARALSANLEEGEVAQGGSTITQQLVKNSLTGDEQTLSRKVREAVLAVELEKQLSKDEILERYLNTVYFGNGAYGVQAASELYFAKDVGELNWAEGALLAALIRAPSDYDPFKYPKVALERRDLVFRRLVETNRADEAVIDYVTGVPLPVAPQRLRPVNDYFVEAVKQQLLSDRRLGRTYPARRNALYGGGLRIYTTYDPIAQALAVQARDQTMPNSNGDGTFPVSPATTTGRPQFGTAAVASVEPSTGAVRVLVGGPGYDKFKYNIALQDPGRQPGSSFKTFVLVAAMEAGYSPEDLVNGRGPCGDVPGNWGDVVPNNFEGSSGGVNSITSQTLRSSNCAFLRLGQVVGLDRVVDVARRMGITTPLDPSRTSLPIGTAEVRPLDMAAAYAVLANDGMRNPPYFVDRVEDRDGNVLFQHQVSAERVLSPDVARLATQVLIENVEEGTGTRAQLNNGQDAAGKTGTTNDAKDVWFVGYTPNLSTAVWMGAAVEPVPLGFGAATGGRYPAATWGAYMNSLVGDQEPVEFEEAPDRDGGEYLRMPNERGSRRRSSDD
jgi:penicillin-binding protein 1A